MKGLEVLGVGARTPPGRGADALLEGLLRGEALLRTYEPFRAAGLRFPLAAAVPEETLAPGTDPALDRGARLLEGALRDALVSAFGSDAPSAWPVPPSRVALVAGTSSSGVGPFCEAVRSARARPEDDARYGSATHRVASLLGARGPVLCVCSVCASGAIAIAEACELLLDGACDLALAAGFDPLEPFVGAGFDALGATSPEPRPFRAGRRGLALGEGSAALVLARPGLLPASPWGRVRGWGLSGDAVHLTAPDAQGRGVARAIERALALAELPRERVRVVNAHGTGTPFNDAMESAALALAFGPRGGERAVYTVKGTLGHTLGAAGAIEAVTSLAAMRAGVVPPTCTRGEPDPRCDLDLVTEPRALDYDLTLSLSSAFGGANCALLLERP